MADDEKTQRELSSVREVQERIPRPHSDDYTEKGARVVSQGNVNADKPPSGTGPVANDASKSGT
jgi:hypothetical protein